MFSEKLFIAKRMRSRLYKRHVFALGIEIF